MENKVNIKTKEGISYDRWKKIISLVQLALAIMILITEIVSNILLYVTRSQGYGPDTIVVKLLRYLVLTSAINFAIYFICKFIVKHTNNDNIEKYTLIISTSLIGANVMFSHYQFSICFGIASIPIMLTIFYEDKKLSSWALGINACGLASGIISRALDSSYNTDIGPETAISFVLLFTIYIVSRIIINVLIERRKALDEALIASERARYLVEVEKMSIQMLTALVQILDAKDSYTNGHSYRVSEYSQKLGKAIGYSAEELETIKQEALLHDIGKIGVPDSVLNKPGRLSDIEYNVMKSHTSVGSEILQNMISLPDATLVANSHHERYDGTGYPLGLKGEDIPVHARIVAIADAYDAMSSDRIYRKALSKDKIYEQLKLGRGTQFDPNLLDVFIDLMEKDQLKIEDPESEDTSADATIDKFVNDLKKALIRKDNTAQLRIDIVDKFAEEIKSKAHQSFAVVLFSLNTHINGDSTGTLGKALNAMDLSVRKNIRANDVYTQYSNTQCLIVLKKIHPENITLIIDRILLDFYSLVDKEKYTLDYEVGKYNGEN